jgi:leucyl aminopeptidase
VEFSTKGGAPDRITSDCVVVGVFEKRRLAPTAESLDRAARGHLREVLKRGDMDGRAGTSRLLVDVPHLACERVLLVGLGRESDFGAKQYRLAIRNAVSTLVDTGARDVHLCVPELHVAGKDMVWKLRHAAIAAADALYQFEEMKSKKSPARRLRSVTFLQPGRNLTGARGLVEGRAISAGMALARDLGNLPANVCTPTYLADQAVKLGKAWKLGVQVLERRDMERLGMGSLLSVGSGSRQPPKLIVVRYNGAAKSEKPVVLVGKGVTFDTGGISLKPAGDMDEMKYDMCGAASVLGTLRAVAEMKLACNVVGVIPTTENMPGGAATRPGDIVTSMSGQTVEILNTDAEGRLILCDALTYAERFKPQAVIDIATLTGACVIALGHVATGLFSNQDTLAEELLEAGTDAWDRVWRLPLWDDYQEQLKSPFADVANIGGRPAGAVTAASFLARFAESYSWAHLDIAGTAWVSGKNKGATGRPVPLLSTFLIGRAGK